MSQLAIASLALLCFLFLPELDGDRWAALRASPRLSAAGHLVRLIGLGVLPAGWLACLATGFVGLVSHSPGIDDGCWLGLDLGIWRLLLYGLALAALLPVGWQAGQIVRRTARLQLVGAALAKATKHRLRGGGVVWVVPSEQVMAYATGLVRPHAVVTSGLLELLTPPEREAVLEHEGAHVRFGHPQLLLLGAAVARAYGFLPPVRQAWAGLNRELEVAADQEAARLVGAAPLITALARIGLTTAVGGRPALASGAHLRHRIRRLQEPCRPRSVPANALAGLRGLVLVVAFSWSACVLLLHDPLLPQLVPCVAAMTAIGLRPTWPWPRRER
jgi:hypothetical protein